MDSNYPDLEWSVGCLDSDLHDAQLQTLSVRAGQHRGPEAEHCDPIYMTSSFVFRNAEEAAARFKGDLPGNVYSRYTNPTVRSLEERMTALEGGEAAVGTASGMSAILSVVMSICSAGDRILVSQNVFGSTINLFEKTLSRFGLDVDYIPLKDIDAWRKAFVKPAKMIFVETPSNPLADLIDLSALADVAHSNQALLVVDNCFLTPVFQKPMALGADLVIHSATKFLDGHGRCLGGVIVGKKNIIDQVIQFIRSAGPSMSPFNAWLILKSLETLSIRMRAHEESAITIAHWLEVHPKVQKVYYTGLQSHPQHLLAIKQQQGHGAVVSFEVKGDKQAAWDFINATSLMSITANLGDTKTTLIHPASTTHGRLNQAQRIDAGIHDNLLRVAVGLEDVEDLKKDLMRGFKAISV